jgi:DNA-directed RNA polymerase subunit E"
MIYEGERCPGCGSQEYTEEIKGRVIILDPENSEIAKKLKISKRGEYVISSR